MSEDESEIDSRAVRAVKAGAADRHKPIGLDGQTQSLPYGNVASDKRIDGEKRLLVENGTCFRKPIVAVTLEHIVCGFHTASECRSDVWVEAAGFPVPICQDTGPEHLVMASFHEILLKSKC